MADILVTSPFQPFTLPTQFKAVFNGYIYCGTVDAVDPSVSQVQVYLVNEAGDKVPVAQPLRTNAGGYLVYNGQPAKFVTDSNHSLLVQDSFHVQVWYAPDMANIDPASAVDVAIETILDMLDDHEGSALVGFIQSGVGAAVRTSLSKMRDIASVRDYGAIGDGTYHPLSEMFSTLLMAQVVYPFATSLTQSIDWAAIQATLNSHDKVYAPEGSYVITDTIAMNGGQWIVGDGCDSWWPGYAIFCKADRGTNFLMYGTGAKVHELDGVSNCDTGGGVITNPSAADPYTVGNPSPSYSLTDFTNANAFGTTRATLRQFSVGLMCSGPGAPVLEGFRIVPYFNGQAGYQSENETGLGDEWDVGIWLKNTAASSLNRIQAVGYWRIAGTLKSCIFQGQPEVSVGGERDNISQSILQGYRGFIARSYDTFAVTAVSAGSIEIPWSASHRFPISGTIRVQGADRTYSGLTFGAGKLTFTGVSDISGVTTSSFLRLAGDSFGMSGTQLNDTYISALNHHSRVLATCQGLDSPFDRASACYELSGEPMRAIKLRGCTAITWDEIIGFTGNIRDHQRTDTYIESQSCRSTIGGALDIAAGSRLIAVRIAGSTSPFPVLQTTGLQAVGGTYGPGVDMSPRYTSGAAARFVTGGGMYSPREDYDTTKMFPMRQDATEMESTTDAYVTCGVSASVLLGATSGDANVKSRTGSLNLLSGLRVRLGNSSGTFWYIADGAKLNPQTDNTQALGQPANRWSVVYAGTGTINTSDGRDKTVPLPIDDAVLDAWGDVQLITFKWLESIRLKEDEARWHFGVIAQQVRDAFIARGLDGTRYGLLCYDEWEASEEEGVSAGNLWGIRADQCLFLEAAYQRRRCDRIEARLAAIGA